MKPPSRVEECLLALVETPRLEVLVEPRWDPEVLRYRAPVYGHLRSVGYDVDTSLRLLRMFGCGYRGRLAQSNASGNRVWPCRRLWDALMAFLVEVAGSENSRGHSDAVRLEAVDVAELEAAYAADGTVQADGATRFSRRWALTMLGVVLKRLATEQELRMDQVRWILHRRRLTGESEQARLEGAAADGDGDPHREDRDAWTRRLRARFVELAWRELGSEMEGCAEIDRLRASLRVSNPGSEVSTRPGGSKSGPAEDGSVTDGPEAWKLVCTRCDEAKIHDAPYQLCPNCLLELVCDPRRD
ncbi:MAG: hypothetical protein JNL97_12735 [Verrucomicrobiales bacterium]|nr:hypothetical protein [Verrucomicrobiales bacterium]